MLRGMNPGSSRPASFSVGHIVGWISRRRYSLAIAGILVYNNWLLALVLEPYSTWHGATISELSAVDQPWSWLYRALDVVAGGLILLSTAQIAGIARQRWQRRVLLGAMVLLGGVTILDALLPMDCSPALNAVCALNEHAGNVSTAHMVHLIESPIAYAGLFLLPAVAIAATRRQTENALRRLGRWSWGLVIIMIIWAIETIYRTFALHTNVYGYDQRVFTVLFTAWFLLAISTAQTRLRAQAKPA